MSQTGVAELCGHSITVLTESDLVAALRGWTLYLASQPPGVEHVHLLRIIRQLSPGLDCANVLLLQDALLDSAIGSFEVSALTLAAGLRVRAEAAYAQCGSEPVSVN